MVKCFAVLNNVQNKRSFSIWICLAEQTSFLSNSIRNYMHDLVPLLRLYTVDHRTRIEESLIFFRQIHESRKPGSCLTSSASSASVQVHISARWMFSCSSEHLQQWCPEYNNVRFDYTIPTSSWKKKYTPVGSVQWDAGQAAWTVVSSSRSKHTQHDRQQYWRLVLPHT